MAIPDPATTNWVPIWNPLSQGPVGPQGPPGPQGPAGPSVAAHAPTHYAAGNDPVNIRQLAGYNGVADNYLNGAGNFVAIPGISGVALLAAPNQFTQPNTFTALQDQVTLNAAGGGAPSLMFYNQGEASGDRRLRLVMAGGALYVQQVSDDMTAIANVFWVDNAGVANGNGAGLYNLNASFLATGTVPEARLPPGIAYQDRNNNFTLGNTFNGDTVFSGFVRFTSPGGSQSPTIISASPRINYFENDRPVNGKIKSLLVDAEIFQFVAIDDNYSFTIATYASIGAFGVSVNNGTGLIYANGAQLTNLNASALTTGIAAPPRLGTGTANATTFLRGDGVWAPISSDIPSGLIALFSVNCPVGWTRVAALDNRLPLGSTGFGTAGGSTQHSHGIGLNTTNAGGHTHAVSVSGSGNGPITGTAEGDVVGQTADVGTNQTADAGGSHQITAGNHRHNVSIHATFSVSGSATVSVSASGGTDNPGDHSHQVNGNTAIADLYPPYLTVIYCQKN